MKEYPNYSVLMSLYMKENPEHFKLALESMLDQTIKPDEVVVVEDGPLTEGLYAVLDSYADCGVPVHRVRNEKNLGLGLALRVGLKECRNELIARMDTDDISNSDRCEKQLAYMLNHPEVSVVGSQICEFIDSIDNVVAVRRVPDEADAICRFAKKRCPLNHMTVMFRKSEVEDAGGYQDWYSNEDYYLWVRMMIAGKKFGNLPSCLVSVRVGKEMYERRGGWKYFVSEIKLQRYMLKKQVISLPLFMTNCIKRVIVQLLLPNKWRGWVYQTFARE